VFLAIGLRFTKEVQKETIQQNLGTDSRPATVSLFPFLVRGGVAMARTVNDAALAREITKAVTAAIKRNISSSTDSR
jgi:hypothetical protein